MVFVERSKERVSGGEKARGRKKDLAMPPCHIAPA